MQQLLIFIIRLYQRSLSLLIGGECRFYPSCSSYAIEAIETYGCIKGCWLAIKRIGRCHPGHPGGLDPVPSPRHRNHKGC